MKSNDKTREQLLKEIEILETKIAELEKSETECRHAKEELKKLSFIVEQSTEGIALADLNGNIMFANRSWCEIHGFKKKDECLGKNLEIFHSKEQLQNDVIPFNEKLKQLGTYSGEVGHITKDGKEFPTFMKSILLKDDHGNPFAMVGIVKEITGRKIAEKELMDSEREKRLILDSISELVAYEDKELRIQWANKAAADSVCMSIAELLGKHCYEIWPKLNEPCTGCPVKKCIETGKPQEMEMTTPDGRIWNIRGYPVKEENGDIMGAVEVTQEITKIKQSENKIKYLNQILKAIRNVNQLITKEKDRDKLIKGACENFIETSGYYNTWIALLDNTGKFITGAEAGLGKDFLLMLELLKQGKFTNCSKKALNQKGLIVTETPIKICKDCPLSEKYEGRGGMTIRLEYEGKIYGLFSVSVPLDFLKDQEQQHLFEEVANDIAFALYRIEVEKKHNIAENKLQESEQNFRDLIEKLMDGVAIADENAYHIYVNPKFSEITGYSKDELLNMTGWDLARPQDRAELKQRMKDRLEDKPIQTYYERIIVRKNGTEIPVEMSTTTTIWQGKKCAMAIIHDIAERKKAEKEIQKKSAELKKQFEISERQRIANLVVLNDLNKTTKDLKAEIKQRKQAEEIQTTIYNISKAVSKVKNPRELFVIIREYLGIVVDTTNFYIALYDKETDTISLPFNVDQKDDYESFPAGKTLTKYVIETEKPLLVDDILLDKLIEEGKVESIGSPSKIWLGVPLKIENQVIGVIAVQSYDDPNLYTEKDIEILSFVSDEIALAIQHIQSDEQIKSNLKEKTLLLQEIHHRTKNNMAVISAMLSMQKRRFENEQVNTIFKEIINKIKAMALVHQKLYQVNDLSNIDFKDYIKELMKLIMQSYGSISKRITLKLEMKKVRILIDSAIPLGLVINELVSNILKHAFPDNRDGQIFVRLFKDKDETINLQLGDNGVGFPENFDVRKNSSMGLNSVFSIVEKQLKGEIDVVSENGLKWEIRIKDNLHKGRI